MNSSNWNAVTTGEILNENSSHVVYATCIFAFCIGFIVFTQKNTDWELLPHLLQFASMGAILVIFLSSLTLGILIARTIYDDTVNSVMRTFALSVVISSVWITLAYVVSSAINGSIVFQLPIFDALFIPLSVTFSVGFLVQKRIGRDFRYPRVYSRY